MSDSYIYLNGFNMTKFYASLTGKAERKRFVYGP